MCDGPVPRCSGCITRRGAAAFGSLTAGGVLFLLAGETFLAALLAAGAAAAVGLLAFIVVQLRRQAVWRPGLPGPREPVGTHWRAEVLPGPEPQQVPWWERAQAPYRLPAGTVPARADERSQ